MNIFKNIRYYIIGLLVKKMYDNYVKKHNYHINYVCNRLDTKLELVPFITTTPMAVGYFIKIKTLIDYVATGVKYKENIINTDLTASETLLYKEALKETSYKMIAALTDMLKNSKDNSVLIYIITKLSYMSVSHLSTK